MKRWSIGSIIANPRIMHPDLYREEGWDVKIHGPLPHAD